MASMIADRVEACRLDLHGLEVVTEGATNAYAATAAAASAAGAQVWAYVRDTRHGTVDDAKRDVLSLVARLGRDSSSVHFSTERDELPFSSAHLFTNSGVLRPITSRDIDKMRSDSVIALMYELWEARSGDIDMAAARRFGIEVVGVDESHPLCGSFEFVGSLAVTALRRRGWMSPDVTVGVLSNNPFGPEIMSTLSRHEVGVELLSPDKPLNDVDVVVVATTPNGVTGSFGSSLASRLVIDSAAAACVQLWGDLDRGALRAAGIELEPEQAPPPGHQGVGMEEAGFEPVIRLQVAGIAAAIHRQVPPDSPLFGLAQRHVELSN